jgi:carboxypeptidase Taq
MDVRAAYAELIRQSREFAVLASCSAVLGWDEQTFMPPGSTAHRAEQMAHLAGLHHQHATHPRIGELLARVEGSDLVADPEGEPAAVVREIRRSYRRRTRLPGELVKALAQTTSLAKQEWAAARRHADFGRFRPWLERIVQLKRQEAECLSEMPDSKGQIPDSRPQMGIAPGSGLGSALYDALLDEYEPGAKSDELAVLFQALREQLVPLVQEIVPASAGRAGERGDAILRRRFPLDRQKVFGEAVAGAVGFDFQRGRQARNAWEE